MKNIVHIMWVHDEIAVIDKDDMQSTHEAELTDEQLRFVRQAKKDFDRSQDLLRKMKRLPK